MTTTLGQIETGSNGNKRVLHILQGSRTEAAQPDCLMSYPGHNQRCTWGIVQPQPAVR